jgi:hypothetical protein
MKGMQRLERFQYIFLVLQTKHVRSPSSGLTRLSAKSQSCHSQDMLSGDGDNAFTHHTVTTRGFLLIASVSHAYPSSKYNQIDTWRVPCVVYHFFLPSTLALSDENARSMLIAFHA